MKHLLAPILLAAPLLATIALATPAAAQQAKQDFTLVNRTGYELSQVHVSPRQSNDWEDDVLGQDTLADGERVAIRFQRSVKSCMWDLKVTYSVDDSTAIWRGIDLCSVERITIRYNKNTDTTSAAFD